MKLQINTEDKTLKIEEPILLEELIKTLNSLFPNESWKEYKLETSIITNWTNPIIIKEPYVQPYNPYNPYPVTTPWWNPITYSTTGTYNSNEQNDKINKLQKFYNLEIN